VSQEQTSKKLKIVFGGESHSIDADILIESLVSYSMVVQEVSTYPSPQGRVNIKIQATREGSFELVHDLIANQGNDLFSGNALNYAASVVTVVTGLYGFKKWLSSNGHPEVIEQKGDNAVLVKSNKGEITINNNVFHIYQSSEKTREGLRRTFSKLKEAEEIEDFDILDNDTGENLFHADKTDFTPMSSDSDEIEQRKQKIVRTSQELSVFKIVFKENHKWEFFYEGNRIYATISDKDFADKAIKGEVAFRSGDKMIADLEIVQTFNEAANVFVNDDYFLTKVVQHIPRTMPSQPALDFLDLPSESQE
jgi:hypothetical protein